MKVAFIYQAKEPPVINGIKKPMKPGGYSDGCADMAYCLRNGGTDVITPAENPDVYKDTDCAFPIPTREYSRRLTRERTRCGSTPCFIKVTR